MLLLTCVVDEHSCASNDGAYASCNQVAPVGLGPALTAAAAAAHSQAACQVSRLTGVQHPYCKLQASCIGCTALCALCSDAHVIPPRKKRPTCSSYCQLSWGFAQVQWLCRLVASGGTGSYNSCSVRLNRLCLQCFQHNMRRWLKKPALLCKYWLLQLAMQI
jgi:hypothetical protein